MQKIITDIKLDFDDVLIRPKRSLLPLDSRSNVDVNRKFKFKHSPRELLCTPVVVANMDSVGTFAMAKSVTKLKSIVCLHKHYSSEQLVKFYTEDNSFLNKELAFYSTGIGQKDIEKLNYTFDQISKDNYLIPNICIDVANGYTEYFVKTVAKIRQKYPNVIIIAGNVVTPEMVEELIIHGGVDIVKVGIGSGSVCTTRLKTGVGYPQLSAVMECSDAAHGLGGHICSDGGCKQIGDVSKALGGNGDFVMLGSLFAGTDECEGTWEYSTNTFVQEKVRFKYYGMSSKDAMEKHYNGVACYKTVEGKTVTVPYKGTATEVLQNILGGIRSTGTYIGADKVKDFGKKTTFILVNNTHNKIYEKH
jgi:GMP reductase